MQTNHREDMEDATVRLFLDGDFEGSAFFIIADGWLLTAYHCIVAHVQKTVNQLTVATRDDTRYPAVYHPGKSLPEYDLAVLKVETAPPACLPLGAYREDFKGSAVVAVGYPAVHDHDPEAGYYPGAIFHHTRAKIESDAGKGKGQSGGPLFHPGSNRVIGVICEGYQAHVISDAGLAARLEPLFTRWPQLDALNKRTIAYWDSGLALPVVLEQNPYKGLAAFQETDALRFFGREAEAAALFDIVHKRHFCALMGASGSGKSSLVFAGLLPRLSQTGQWDIRHFRPKNQPFAQLLGAFTPPPPPQYCQSFKDWQSLLQQLDKGELGLSRLCAASLHSGKRLLLIADQFEELFTLNPDPGLQRRFCQCLSENLRGALPPADTYTLLLTLRADFLAQSAEYLAGALNHSNLILGPLSAEGKRAAIEKPLPEHFSLEQGLTKRILQDLGDEPGALPLLQFTLDALWQSQRRRVLTHAAYETIGTVRNALAVYADSLYAEFSDAEKTALRRLFIQLVQPGEGTEDTRKVADLRQFSDPLQQALIQNLAGKRLLVTGENTVEVAHEALLRHWQPLRDWLKEDRPFRVWQEGLQRYLQDQMLLSGAALATAQEWLENRGEEITAKERGFIYVTHLTRFSVN